MFKTQIILQEKRRNKMKTVSTPNAPAAIGPYSQAKIVNGLVFCSGQIPINPASGAIEASTIEEQTRQACLNVKALLEAAGFFG